MKIKICIVLFCLCFNTKAQVYYAGELFSGYIDLIPDTAINFNFQVSPTEVFYFDFNQDFTNDYKIEAYNSGGLGGVSRYISVVPLISNASILKGRIDSVYHNFYNYWIETPLAEVLHNHDSINHKTANWSNQNLYLTNNSGSAGTYVNPTDWIGANDFFIGLKLETASDTVYGWIRVNCPLSGKCIIKDYSSTGFKITEHELIVSPVPVSDFKLKITGVNDVEEFSVYDNLGKWSTLYAEKTDDGYLVLLPSNLMPGSYFLKMKSNSQTIVRQILVTSDKK